MASWWARHRLTVALLFLALALRLLHWADLRDSPYYLTPVLDAEEYGHLARSLLTGQWAETAAGTYVHGVLYPVLWAGLELVGGGAGTVRAVQAVLGSLSVVLLYQFALRLLAPRAALLCGLLAAGYWPAILFGGELLATTLVVFLELVLVAHLACHAERPSPRAGLVAGVLLALLVATRSNTLLLVPVVIGWLAWRTAQLARPKAPVLGAVVVGFSLATAPFLAANYSAQRTPVPFQGAWSFYMGANPEADGTPYARQGLDWQRLESLGFRDGSDVSRAARGRVYLVEGLRFIGAHPVAYAELLYRKLRLFWHTFEVPVSIDLAYHNEHSRLRPWLPAGFGVIAPLALVGMVANRQRWREWGLAYGGVLAFLVSGLLFTVCARYRLPAVPFLLLFAAEALHRGARALSAGDRRGALRLAGLLVAAVLVVHTGVDPAAADHLRSPWLQGTIHMRRGDAAQAEAAYLAARRQFPGDADVLNSLGAARQRLGRTDEAEATYREALALAPEHSRARLNLSRLLRLSGRLAAADSAARLALANDPRPGIQHEAHAELGTVAIDRGDLPAAMAAFTAALQLQERSQTRYLLAGVCHRLGRLDEEVEHLELAVERTPDYAAAQRNLGALYLQRGQLPEAETALAHAVRLQPEVAIAHEHLGALYLRTGRADLARSAFDTARRLRTGGSAPR